MKPTQKKFLTIKQVADQLQVSESTVRRAIRAGKLQSTKVLGSIRIQPEWVDKFTCPIVTANSGPRVASIGQNQCIR